MTIPGNFFDAKTGEALRPVFKWQDAMGVWHQKELAHCTWSELYDNNVGLWNELMTSKVSVHQAKQITLLDMLKMALMAVGAATLLVSILILVAMFVQ